VADVVYVVKCDIVVEAHCTRESGHSRLHRFVSHLSEQTVSGDVWARVSVTRWEEGVVSYTQGRHHQVLFARSGNTFI